MSHLSVFLKTRREEIKKTQYEVSKAVGYDQTQSVSNWERAIVPPPQVKLRAYAKALRTPYKTFVNLLVEDYRVELNKRSTK